MALLIFILLLLAGWFRALKVGSHAWFAGAADVRKVSHFQAAIA